jgi:hypothetical protein
MASLHSPLFSRLGRGETSHINAVAILRPPSIFFIIFFPFPSLDNTVWFHLIDDDHLIWYCHHKFDTSTIHANFADTSRRNRRSDSWLNGGAYGSHCRGMVIDMWVQAKTATSLPDDLLERKPDTFMRYGFKKRSIWPFKGVKIGLRRKEVKSKRQVISTRRKNYAVRPHCDDRPEIRMCVKKKKKKKKKKGQSWDRVIYQIDRGLYHRL